jgi:hypothetical protein
MHDIVLQTSKPIASHITRSNSAANKGTERPPFRASLRSGSSGTRVKPRRRQGKERPLAAVEAEEKRRTSLERNRVAANKCRKRKSEQVASLQEKEVALERENTRMKLQRAQIKDEIGNLKDMVMMHALCNHPDWYKDAEMVADVPAQQAVGTLVVGPESQCDISSVTLPAVAPTRPQRAQVLVR